MAEDVSNKTIVVLVVLTVLVSLLSTLVVVNEVLNLKTGSASPAKEAPQSTQGKVSMEIKAPPATASSTGMVVLGIK